MALKLLLGDTAAPHKLSPPALVAEMWSTHVQDTRAYADFCQALGRGFVHMDPAAAGDAKEARDARLVRARAMYTHGFGCAPPMQIWGDGTSAGGGGNGGGGGSGGRRPLQRIDGSGGSRGARPGLGLPAAAAAAATLTLGVRRAETGEITYFKLRHTTPLGRVFDVFAARAGVARAALAFSAFGGRPVGAAAAPADLELSDGDVIESHLVV
ncbi:hypothetical protein JKP88DRAFT_293196 [Tribonema minus]|uniref:Rad60/SUMO-like domain-containing protein n=1 Tax=Tribonema minus TaxID=303371 RepID=A0A835ZHW6_9STRA|nr:hypothetical protein JKP88DRAFT_293196 [Tribonema minus]